MIDLCSGLGGASQPFIDRGWNVSRVDNNPKFKNIIYTFIISVKDIEKSKLFIPGEVDFVWASPPCNCFSMASIHLNWTKRRKPKHIGVINAIRNVVWCLDAIDFLKPKFWALENPRGKLRNILNKPGVIYPGLTTDLGLWGAKSPKPTDIWGKFPEITSPCIELGTNTKPDNGAAGKNNLAVLSNGDVNSYQVSMYGNAKKKWNNQSSRAEMRALIPYKLGETLAIEIEKELGNKI